MALLKLSKMYCMRPKYAGVKIPSRHPMADRWREGSEGLVTPPAPGGVDKDCHHDADGYDASPRHGAGYGHPDGGAGQGASLGRAALEGAIAGQHCPHTQHISPLLDRSSHRFVNV